MTWYAELHHLENWLQLVGLKNVGHSGEFENRELVDGDTQEDYVNRELMTV